MFDQPAGVNAKHIPYKGVGPLLADLIGGQVDFDLVAMPAVHGRLKSGALRAIGVIGKSRVPTIAERRRRLLKSEQERYARLVRMSNISVDRS